MPPNHLILCHIQCDMYVARVEISTLVLDAEALSASQDVISPGPGLRPRLQPGRYPLLICLCSLNCHFLFRYFLDLHLLV